MTHVGLPGNSNDKKLCVLVCVCACECGGQGWGLGRADGEILSTPPLCTGEPFCKS